MIPLQQYSMVTFGGAPDVILLTNQTISRTSAGTAYAEYQIDSDGGVYKRQATTFATPTNLVEQWCTPGSSASKYEVSASLSSGTLNAGSAATGSWLALTSDRLWYVSDSEVDAVIVVTIRDVATATTQASATITLHADAF